MSATGALPPLRWAVAALLVSAALQWLCFMRWPGNPTPDVAYSIFAAQNFLAHGQLASVNALSDFGGDLAQFAKPRWLIQFPPGQSLLYAAAMGLGLSAGAATKLLALASLAAGGFGWIVLARFLGASQKFLFAVAVLYPWLPFVGMAYLLYTNDHLALAVTPWVALALLQVEPASLPGGSGPNWRGLLVVAFVALLAVFFKYSMAPIFIAAGLCLLARDGFRARGLAWSTCLVALLVFPALLSLAVDHAYRPRIALRVAAPSLPQTLENFLDNSIAATPGWDIVLRGAGPYLARLVHGPLPQGLLTVISLALLAVWAIHFRRARLRGRQKSFALFCVTMTGGLWAMLWMTTYIANSQTDFSAVERYYKPTAMLWLLACGLLLDKMGGRALLRSAAFYSLALPIAVIAMGYVWTGLETPYPAMPGSATAWTQTRDPAHAAFLSKFASAHRPGLVISAEPWAMTELGVPGIYSQVAILSGIRYWSSTNLEVWMLLKPSERKLLANIRGAVIARAPVPPGYPFDFYILRFPGEFGTSVRVP